MSQIITIGKRALGTVGATVLGVVVLIATGGAALAGPTVWSQLTGRVRIDTHIRKRVALPAKKHARIRI